MVTSNQNYDKLGGGIFKIICYKTKKQVISKQREKCQNRIQVTSWLLQGMQGESYYLDIYY